MTTRRAEPKPSATEGGVRLETVVRVPSEPTVPLELTPPEFPENAIRSTPLQEPNIMQCLPSYRCLAKPRVLRWEGSNSTTERRAVARPPKTNPEDKNTPDMHNRNRCHAQNERKRVPSTCRVRLQSAHHVDDDNRNATKSSGCREVDHLLQMGKEVK